MFVEISPDERSFTVTSDAMALTEGEVLSLHRRMQGVFHCNVTMPETGRLNIALIDCCAFPLSVRLAGIHRVLLGHRDFSGRIMEYELGGQRYVRYTDGSVFQRNAFATAVSA
jgi:hypothetical protein